MGIIELDLSKLMKSYTPKPLVMLSFICSILFFTSCNKDSDLFDEYVLLDPETEPIENADGVGTGGSEETDGSGQKEAVGNLLIDDTFDSKGRWELENGSTISGGVMTLISDGQTMARVSNILNEQYYATRRYKITFDARQTKGSGVLQLRQSNYVPFEKEITSTWTTYTVEFDGNAVNSSNNINFRGLDVGDTFEIDNLVMEIIGDTSNPNVPGKPAQITFFTDFELATYGYDQLGVNGSPPSELNQWEVDQGTPRDTSHPESAVTSGRDGTGKAVWLGVYNNNDTRNEIGRDIAMPFGEFWNGFSFYVQDSLNHGRILMQLRNLAPGGSSTVNAISLRQDNNTGGVYFSICTDVNFVDQTKESLGYWNGAGTNTQSVPADYNYRGWNDVVIHYKGAFGADYTGPDTSELAKTFGYDPRSDGFIEIWLNGVKVVDHVGTTLYRYEKQGGEIRWGFTPKIGTYWGGPTSFAVGGNAYYDNYAIWVGPNGTYADVDPSK